MQKNIEKVQTSWPVPVNIKDSFTDFCKRTGSLVQDDVAGAMVIWQYLPAQIREQAKLEAKGIPSVEKEFWDFFRAGLELALSRQKSRQEKKDKK